MIRLKPWQWLVLALPVATIVTFLMVAAGMQIHTWGVNWIWAIFTVIFVGWRWLLVKWTKPALLQVESVVAEVNRELEADFATSPSGSNTKQAETILQDILVAAQNDLPIWEDWLTFWQRCQQLVTNISQIYHPEVKYPLLNIHIPQAYGLIRSTVDDTDLWMQKLSPVLNQVTIGQAYQGYEVYRKLEPSAQKLLKVWNLAQWLLNPAAAIAQRSTKPYSNKAEKQLLINLSQLLREAALRNLCRNAVTLYSGEILTNFEPTVTTSPKLQVKTQTLRDILVQAEPVEVVEQKPVNILLVGRTGAGKSSLINTLFNIDKAEVDVLPSTTTITSYHWETTTGETLDLWDSPGYEQVKRSELRDLVLDNVCKTDLVILVTPALDPALQMDVDFLADIKAEISNLPIVGVVTQVDKLRPIREWDANYDWEEGNKPKEIAIREATEYRRQLLSKYCDLVLPVVTGDIKAGRKPWGVDVLSLGIVNAIAPAKQLRLSRFLENLEARTVAAAKVIDKYTFQMATTQGVAAFLKSPILQFISTISTGSPTLAYLLSEKIPVEQLPVVIGKLQMAYELFNLLNDGSQSFDLLSLWTLLLDSSSESDTNSWAFGHALVEYWTNGLTNEQLHERFNYYLQQA
ncbi:GTPase family protein [Calothrix sp. PCC 6303]|uniref:GTPase family protein n=1 Tax=Calothrix sp. PCC 6303 TaxID=1170562 RepID=UPI0002A04344|nr:GTPase family protein [Calothrix sp. PCC 6303]AFY99807.1 small GTP-binding protein [Calothrix sp. PCC 6303]